ncbi:hypothetical protein [uncultured Sphingomonas sp.]|uniref:hypothetical protein n=1 Tax=uncultured Sphingomonas sp. TaxID=158754 RepID=UPI002605F3FE|nr:hypothetical protein [uncultured Sphingomonas sp.]
MIASLPPIDAHAVAAAWSQPPAYISAASSDSGSVFFGDESSVDWLAQISGPTVAKRLVVEDRRVDCGQWMVVGSLGISSIGLIKPSGSSVTFVDYPSHDDLPFAYPRDSWAAYGNVGAAGYWHPIEASSSAIFARPDIAAEVSVRAELSSYAKLQPGWDGPGSIAPTSQALHEAMSFLQHVPIDYSTVEPMVAADGEVGFFWELKSGYVDVTFRGRGEMVFLAKIDGVVSKGRVSLGVGNDIPESLMAAIKLS